MVYHTGPQTNLRQERRCFVDHGNQMTSGRGDDIKKLRSSNGAATTVHGDCCVDSARYGLTGQIDMVPMAIQCLCKLLIQALRLWLRLLITTVTKKMLISIGNSTRFAKGCGLNIFKQRYGLWDAISCWVILFDRPSFHLEVPKYARAEMFRQPLCTKRRLPFNRPQYGWLQSEAAKILNDS